MSTFDEVVGENVRAFRTASNMSQADLAAAIGNADDMEPMHQQTVLKIEKGTRPLKFAEAVRLAEVLQVDLDVLRSITPDRLATVELMRHLHNLSRVTADFASLADHIADEIAAIRKATSWIESDDSAITSETREQTRSLLERAEAVVEANWGNELNEAIKLRLRGNAEA